MGISYTRPTGHDWVAAETALLENHRQKRERFHIDVIKFPLNADELKQLVISYIESRPQPESGSCSPGSLQPDIITTWNALRKNSEIYTDRADHSKYSQYQKSVDNPFEGTVFSKKVRLVNTLVPRKKSKGKAAPKGTTNDFEQSMNQEQMSSMFYLC
jgi:hypothetical protein